MADRPFKIQPVDPFTGKKQGRAVTVHLPSAEDATAALAVPSNDNEDVPDGDEQAVLDWVGHDEGRAKAAVLAERSRGHKEQRSSLLKALNERITG